MTITHTSIPVFDGSAAGRRDRVSQLGKAWPWLIVSAAGLIAFFGGALATLPSAWQRPEYSYAPLVPLITAVMLMRELHRRPLPAAQAGTLPGSVLLGAGLLFGLLGNLAGITDLGTYGFTLAIGGFILVLAGLRNGLRLLPTAALLLFMLPLPQVLYLNLSTALQALSSQLGVGFIDALGIPVLRDGNIIDLGSYRLQVAEACSGLAYLFPMLCLGWLAALLYPGPRWHRALLVASTIPITVVMNAARIGIIGLLVNRHGIAQAEGFLHFFEGWVVFMACTLILYGEAWLLKHFAAGGGSSRNVLDLDFQGIASPLPGLLQRRASTALIVYSLVVLAAGILWQAHQDAPSGAPARESLVTFPMQIGGWEGHPEYLDASTLRVLGADDHLNASYVKGQQRVELLLTYYAAQTSGQSGVHSPEVCLPAGGWDVSLWERKTIATGDASRPVLTVNRAVIQQGVVRQLVYYWFEQRGSATASEYGAKLAALRDAIAMGRSDGGLVRLVTPIGRHEDAAAADTRLEAMAARITPMLSRYYPPSRG